MGALPGANCLPTCKRVALMSKTCPRIQQLPEPTNLDELHKQIARFDDWYARDNKTPLAFRKFYVRMTMEGVLI